MEQRSLIGTTTQGLTTANFYYARPNDITIIVNVIGAVQKPGRYEISKSIDLVNLIALAGGPLPDGSSDIVKITRLVESERGTKLKTFEVDLSDISKLTASELTLQPGDILQISRTGWVTARTVFEVFVGAAVIVTAVSQVVIATNR
jgi:protein involved in polysaccharide export with SLBB domain